MTFGRMAVIASIALLLGGCVSIPYETAEPGAFEGSLVVLWVGEGKPGIGDGQFLFVPDPVKPLKFKRRNGQIIQPDMMYTDGGSIPAIAHLFEGFSPWGYAPAYMVHDWLYVARHCIRDGTPTPEQEKLRDVDFNGQSVIMAEAIKALIDSGKVKKNDFAGETITGAVKSFVARQMWDEQGACERERVQEKHADEARRLARALASAGGGITSMQISEGLTTEFLLAPRGKRRAARPPVGGGATFVSRVSF